MRPIIALRHVAKARFHCRIVEGRVFQKEGAPADDEAGP
jgi:hypothetical protein